jgi:hypothetical protein
MPLYARPSAVILALVLSACGDGNGTGPTEDSNPYGFTTSGPGVLSVSPLDTSTLVAATPLGMMAPPGHVLPTDHVYLYFVDAWGGQQQNNDCRARPIRAAGSGVVTFVLQTEAQGDMKVNVQMTKSFHYYYDHVILKSGVGVGSRVNAGDTIGTTTGRCPSMDLGVIDLDVNPPGFVNAQRYGDFGRHAASPYRYFTEPLRSWLYSKVRMYEGVPADKNGRIDWGIPGKLVGDWFHSSIGSMGSSVTMGPQGWPKTVAFAYDWFATQPRISIGGTIAEAGVLGIAPTDPDPATVSVSSGVVAYHGTPVMGRIPAGWLLVQMLATDRIRMEYFANATSRPTAFTSAAQEYVR